MEGGRLRLRPQPRHCIPGAFSPRPASPVSARAHPRVSEQLVDDVLDYDAAEATMGKPGGADLRLGVATGPALYAWEEHPEMGPLIARKFEQQGDVELVRVPFLSPCASSHAYLKSMQLGCTGARPRAPLLWRRAHARPRACACGQGAGDAAAPPRERREERAGGPDGARGQADVVIRCDLAPVCVLYVTASSTHWCRNVGHVGRVGPYALSCPVHTLYSAYNCCLESLRRRWTFDVGRCGV